MSNTPMRAQQFSITSVAGQPQAARPSAAVQPGLAESLAAFEPIALAQVDAAALLDRSEVKYVLHSGLGDAERKLCIR